MLNLKVLENLRTKEEVKEYLMSIGYNADEETIENLKKNYEATNNVNNNLTMSDLDQVAGGALSLFAFWGTKTKWTLMRNTEDTDFGGFISTSGKTSYYCFTNKPNLLIPKNPGQILIRDGLLGILGIGRVINITDMSPKLLNELASLLHKRISESSQIPNIDQQGIYHNTEQIKEVANLLNQRRNTHLSAGEIATFTDFINLVTSNNYSQMVAQNSN